MYNYMLSVSIIIYGLLFSIVYVILVDKSINLYLGNLPYKERFQQSMLIILIIAIFGISLALTIFNNNQFFKNNIIKLGLIFGNIWIIFSSLFINWNIISDEIKLLIIGIIFAIIIWCSYGFNEKSFKNKKEKEIEIEKNKKYIHKIKKNNLINNDKQNKNTQKIIMEMEEASSNDTELHFDFN